MGVAAVDGVLVWAVVERLGDTLLTRQGCDSAACDTMTGGGR